MLGDLLFSGVERVRMKSGGDFWLGNEVAMAVGKKEIQ